MTKLFTTNGNFYVVNGTGKNYQFIRDLENSSAQETTSGFFSSNLYLNATGKHIKGRALVEILNKDLEVAASHEILPSSFSQETWIKPAPLALFTQLYWGDFEETTVILKNYVENLRRSYANLRVQLKASEFESGMVRYTLNGNFLSADFSSYLAGVSPYTFYGRLFNAKGTITVLMPFELYDAGA